ncbi:MAG: hypothetical protein ABJB74_00915 [Gemmatimonas sp.]
MARYWGTAALVFAGMWVVAASTLRAQGSTATDSARLAASANVDDGRAHGITQTLSLAATHRSYRVGATQVTEELAPLSYKLTSPRLALRVSGTPLRLEVPAATLNAWTPLAARLDMLLRVGDTISVYGRSASSPSGLDTGAVRAVAAAGTSVLDLASQSLGVPPQFGVRAIFSIPVREVVVGLSGSVQHEPRPSGTGLLYWQGTTVRGAVTLNALFGDRHFSVTADASHSSADSLGGRNQFPGGGSAGLSADVAGPVDAEGRYFFIADVFYTHPFNNLRADEPTRLIPNGAFMGASAALLTDALGLTWSPSVSLLRESSSASVVALQGTQRSETMLAGSAWSVAGALNVDVPLGRFLTLSPEFGAVAGTVASTLQQTDGRVIGRRGRVLSTTSTNNVSDAVRGWWGSVVLSTKF